MTIRTTRFLPHGLAALALLIASSTASAATNWSASFGSCNNGTLYAGANAWGSIECATETGGVDVDVRGVATSADSISTFAGQVYSWGGSGLGVVNTDASVSEDPSLDGPHALDSLGRVDGIVLRFSSKVDIDSLSIGWNGTDNPTTTNGSLYNDSDLQLFAWLDTDAPTNFNKATAGWSLIGTYYDVGASNNTSTTKVSGGTANITGSTASSSYWLISALGNNNHDGNIDAFKLLSLAGTVPSTPPGVPEPGSLALLGLGALGLVAARRKSAARH